MTWDVQLPKRTEPIFPPSCIVCGADDPDGFRDIAGGHWVDTLGGLVGGAAMSSANIAMKVTQDTMFAAIPCCLSCARPLRHRDYIRRAFALWSFVAPIAVLCLVLPHRPPPPMRFYVANYTVLAVWCLLGLASLLAKRGDPVTVRRNGLYKRFRFRDKRYARAFAELNGVETAF